MDKEMLTDLVTGAAPVVKELTQQVHKYKLSPSTTKKMKKRVLTIAKSHIKNSALRLRQWYAEYCKSLPVNSKLILFESREGNGFVGNPYAFFKYIQQDTRFLDYTFCWVYHEDIDLNEIKLNIENMDRVVFVRRKSKEYARMLATAGYIFNNTTTLNMFLKREGQTFISTWHGTPLKSLAFDSPYDPINPFPIRNGMRNFLMADYLIGPNKHTADVLLNAYKVNGLYDGYMLQGGYPRIDLTFNTPKDIVFDKLKKANVILDLEKPTIMYTPTWRGRFLADADVDLGQMTTEINLLREHVQDRYNLLVKVHPVAYNKIHEDGSLDDILVPNWADANEMMRVVDLLITDYSSIFFDYMVTDKPILFYCWDDDIYSKNRNMYLDLSTLPGPILHTMSEVNDAIDNIDEISRQYHDKYIAMKQFLLPYDDGNVTQRDVDAIFFKNYKQDKLVVRKGDQHKKRLLFYLGNLNNNIVTRRFMNVLSQIDFDKTDVTILLSPKNGEETWENLRKITEYVRPMYRQGYPLFTLAETLDDSLIRQIGITNETAEYYPKDAYKVESQRIFGRCHFDVAIDFAGNSAYWSRYILECNADKKVIFQQYDLSRQISKLKKSKHKGRVCSLKTLMSMYPLYDKVICVDKCYLSNKEFTKQYVIPEKYVHLSLSDEEIDLKWPIYKRDGSSNMHEIRKVAVPKEYGMHSFIPDIQKINETVSIEISPEDKLYTVMYADNEQGNNYIKLILNNIYVGWDLAENYDFSLDEILNEYPVSYYATIAKANKYKLWNVPKNTEPDSYAISGAKRVKGIMFYIDKECITTSGTYAHLIVDNEDFGYINKKALNMHIGNTLIQKTYNYSSKQKIDQRFYKSIPAEGTIILSSDTPIWNQAYGSYGNTESNINKELIIGKECKVTWMMETKCGQSFEVETPYGQKFWIFQDDMTKKMIIDPINIINK